MNEIPDDFAFLSDDIIHDVLQFVYFEQLMVRLNLQSIPTGDPPVGGRWGEIAHKFRVFKLVGNEIEEYRLDGPFRIVHCGANGRNVVAVNSLNIDWNTDFNQINHLAADAYELLEVYCDVIPKEFLQSLGNRFTSIIWLNRNEGQTEIDFLKRQLKSPHLRILECGSSVLTRPEFIDLLVDFVKKKNFETLISTSLECLSPEVFLAAYESWIQRRDREHLQSSICAQSSTEDLRKLTARIPNFSWNQRIEGFRTEWSYSERHPTADHYEMLMSYNEWSFVPSDVKNLSITLQ